MEKTNKRSVPKILLGISIIIIVIAIVYGLCVAMQLKGEMYNYVPDSEFSQILSVFGNVAMSFLSIYLVGVTIGIHLILIALMWGVYGLILLIKKLKQKNK